MTRSFTLECVRFAGLSGLGTAGAHQRIAFVSRNVSSTCNISSSRWSPSGSTPASAHPRCPPGRVRPGLAKRRRLSRTGVLTFLSQHFSTFQTLRLLGRPSAPSTADTETGAPGVRSHNCQAALAIGWHGTSSSFFDSAREAVHKALQTLRPR